MSWWLIALLAWLAPGVLVSLALLWTAWLHPALRGSRPAIAETDVSAPSVIVAAEPAAELCEPEHVFIAVPALAGVARESDVAADLQALPSLAARCSPAVALEV